MNADDLTRGQARTVYNKLTPMVEYLNRLGKRMSDRHFPADDPARVMVVDALKAVYKLRAEMECRSIDGRGIEDTYGADECAAKRREDSVGSHP